MWARFAGNSVVWMLHSLLTVATAALVGVGVRRHHVAVLTRLGEVSKENAGSAHVGALRDLTAAHVHGDVVRAAGAREAVEEQVARLAGSRVGRSACSVQK